MSRIVLQPTETAHWHSLVCEAEQVAQCYLDEELQSYVVFLLMRFLGKPQIASRIVALDYLHGMRASGSSQYEALRDVGDICLLHAGLYPERSRRRRVSRDYYVEMGCGAYLQLADAVSHGLAALFGRLSQEFLDIMNILQSMRELGNQLIDEEFRLRQRKDTGTLDSPEGNQASFIQRIPGGQRH